MFHLITIAAVLLVQGSAGAKLNFLTRNVALHNSTETYPPRQDRLNTMIEELRTSGADGICLQEVWYSNDMEQIMSDLQMEYPYSFSRLHRPNGELISTPAEPFCSSKGLGEFLLCVHRHCPNASNWSDAVRCGIYNCEARLGSVPPICGYCVLLSGRLDYNGECVTAGNFSINLGGLLYLSKRKIVKAAFQPLDVSDRVNFTDIKNGRGFLLMDIKGIGGVVACTYLTENRDKMPFYEPALPQYKTYEDSNFGQVNQLLTHLIQDQVILMGSFGTGPKYKKRVEAQFPQSYKVIKNATPSFKRSSVKRCTRCGENSVRDHIFVRGHKLKSSRRVFVNETLTDHAAMSALVRTVSLVD